MHAGKKIIEKHIQEKIEKYPQRAKKILASKASLTTREQQVLQMIADGHTDPEIAELLFLSINTIRHYRDALLLKLDANNTAVMVSKALKSGLIH